MHACILTASGGEAGECSICLAPFEEGQRVTTLSKCRHEFHTDCAKKWLTKSDTGPMTCPLCKDDLLAGVEEAAPPTPPASTPSSSERARSPARSPATSTRAGHAAEIEMQAPVPVTV